MGVQAVVVPGDGRGRLPGRRRRHAHEPDARLQGAQEGHRSEAHHRDARPGPAFQSRQFGILDLQGRSAGHSGLDATATCRRTSRARCPARRSSTRSRATSCAPVSVVPNAVQAFIKTNGAITDRVMAAMEAADGFGGDSRCTCPAWPTDGTAPAIPCDGRTSHIAYILDGRSERHQRRLAQQRQVRGVPHHVAARTRKRARTRSSRART